ncbi:hypothetical protein RHSIM_Rhsim06G0002100 [Rhododendron simsii]|uniref:Uncharacterized protein n=1 Tax=Rhododendron simsii TaxID=118357 RepID=A0A834GSJ2_RHOSS|nr:hypothetical protein RHSIM_Rhsim06G0002100 [Rhododendron simsii]
MEEESLQSSRGGTPVLRTRPSQSNAPIFQAFWPQKVSKSQQPPFFQLPRPSQMDLGRLPLSLYMITALKNQVQKIQELTAELENTSQRCEAYRAKLLAVLNIMEEQKLKISVKVQNVRRTLKSLSLKG